MAHKITVELDWDDIELLSNTIWAVNWDDMRWVIDHVEIQTDEAWVITHEYDDGRDGPLKQLQRGSTLNLSDLRKAANAVASSPGRYYCIEEGPASDIAAMVVGGELCDCAVRFIIEYALTGEIQ